MNEYELCGCSIKQICYKHATRLAQPEIEKEERWNKFYLELAKRFSEQSKDPRLKVGCVIVTPTGVLFPGYNGDESGGTNLPDSDVPGESGFVHAEINAITRFDPSMNKNSKMYLTDSPCATCARVIVNSKAISEVYYEREYRVKMGIEILQRAGIAVQKI